MPSCVFSHFYAWFFVFFFPFLLLQGCKDPAPSSPRRLAPLWTLWPLYSRVSRYLEKPTVPACQKWSRKGQCSCRGANQGRRALHGQGLASLVGSTAATCSPKVSVLVRANESVSEQALIHWTLPALTPCPTCSSFPVWVQGPLRPGSPWRQERESLQRWPGRGLSSGGTRAPGLDVNRGCTEAALRESTCSQSCWPRPPRAGSQHGIQSLLLGTGREEETD